MKKILFLMFAMLVLTLSSFGQSKTDLKTKYADYLDRSNAYLKANNSTDKPLSYNKWLVSMGQDTLTQRQKALHRKYDFYFDYIGSNKIPLLYNDWLKKENLVDISGVDYVRKPKSTSISVNSSTASFTQSTNSLPTSKVMTIQNLSSGDYLIKAKKQMITGYVFDFIGVGVVIASPTTGGLVGAGLCGLTGLIFELSGIGNIGKAGMSFNQKGIGITVKF